MEFVTILGDYSGIKKSEGYTGLPLGAMLNLSLVRMVDEISKGHCRLIFSESHTAQMHGEAADQVVAWLQEKGISSELMKMSIP